MLQKLTRISLLLVLAMLAPVGCGNSGKAQVEIALARTADKLDGLQLALETGEVRNATLLTAYAGQLAQLKPGFASLARGVAKDATLAGPTFRSLQTRLAAVREGGEDFASWSDQLAELKAIQLAADPSSFSDALSDPVNVLADLSDGVLPRVNAFSRAEEQRLNNNSVEAGAGSQLVGNPGYGYWSQGAGGTFWQWYGQYAFFSALFGGNRYYYDRWSRGRGYSYYHDVGRNRYTSPRQRATQHEVERTARKNYRGSRPFQSPYARSRQGARNVSRTGADRTRPLFKSPYASSSRAGGGYPGSTRSSSRTRSGVRRGK